MHLSCSLAILHLSCSTLTHALPSLFPKPVSPPHPLPLPVYVVHDFAKGTFVENIALRRNDQILVTLLAPSPDLYQVDPLSIHPPILIHTFAGYTGVLGIVEVDPDVFYVVVGNFSFETADFTPGASSVFEVDIRPFNPWKKAPAAIRKVADFPASTFLNGATLLSRERGEILVADSGAGAVWKLNVRTGATTKIIADDPLLKPKLGSKPTSGINGVHIRNGVLYFTNSDFATLNQIPLNADGSAAGPASTIASGVAGDDFALDAKGKAYVALNGANEVAKVDVPSGKVTVLAGSPQDQVTIAGPASAAFGRTLLDKKSLYIVSDGGLQGYITGNFTVGGRVSRIDLGLNGYYG
ncbi:MAG: hypothetical protein LQ346_007379 [Caloplaca aetnensis]|nr:MAG: hypothetical protein LQ346_007379 [Caloplaca aetnensis]